MSKEMFSVTFIDSKTGRTGRSLKLVNIGHVSSRGGFFNVRSHPLWFKPVQHRSNISPQLTISNELQKMSDMYPRSWRGGSWVDDPTQDTNLMKMRRGEHQKRMSKVLQAVSVIRAENFNGLDPIPSQLTDCTTVGSRFFDAQRAAILHGGEGPRWLRDVH